MPQPLLSFIITIRPHQRVLRRCISAITSQTFTDFEVIVSDLSDHGYQKVMIKRLCPGSDNVKYVATQPQISLWEQLRLCVGNTSGKYIIFIDTDSWLDTDTAETLVSAMEERNIDLAEMQTRYRGSVLKKRGAEMTQGLSELSDTIISGQELRQYIRFIGDGSYLNPQIHNKIYRRELFSEAFAISFPGKAGCQELLNIQYMRAARSMLFLSYAGLNYNRTSADCRPDYRSLEDAKHTYSYKLLCNQDRSCAATELLDRLQRHMRYLIQEQGWTREAAKFFLDRELKDQRYSEAGLSQTADEIVSAIPQRSPGQTLRLILKSS